jgi:transcriptional regulator with GAF, ATPase, and Fis domain
MPALAAATGGSVCLRSNRLPDDFDRLAASFQESGSAALFICLHSNDRITDLLCRPLKIPSLTERLPEFPRLLNAYLDEAAQALGAHHVRLPEPMQQSVLHHVKSLSDIEKAAVRLVALKSSGNLYRAAQQLHMAPISLIRWMSRRGWTTDILAGADPSEDTADR